MTFDLNIVAVKPTAAQTKKVPIKKKKNSKYERRRAKSKKSKKAKQERDRDQRSRGNNEEVGRRKESTKPHDAAITRDEAAQEERSGVENAKAEDVAEDVVSETKQPTETGGNSVQAQPSSLSSSSGTADTRANTASDDLPMRPADDDFDLGALLASQRDNEMKIDEYNAQKAASNSNNTSDGATRITTDASQVIGDAAIDETAVVSDGDEENANHASPSISTNNATSVDAEQDATGNIEEDEKHAEYMAEFHARPLELDRRAGARASDAQARSYNSSHLFQNATEWSHLGLHSRLIQTLESQQFQLERPTKIQIRAIQEMTSKNSTRKQANFLIHSETGSGKTLAYALPILQMLSLATEKHKSNRKMIGTRCLILCPTRELASQTNQVLEMVCRKSFGWLVVGCLSGGDTRKSEKARIRKGLGVIVATPGRLLDHLSKTESLLLGLKGKLQWLVLDEADRLLDMGLGDQVRQIVQRIRANQGRTDQHLRSALVSATVTESVQALAQERMLGGDKAWVWIKGGKHAAAVGHGKNVADSQANMENAKSARGNQEGGSNVQQHQQSSDTVSESLPRQLAQLHLTVSAKLRLGALVAFLVQRVANKERVVVFMDTCASVDYHHKLFASMDCIMSNAEEDSDLNDDKQAGVFGSKSTIFRLHGSVQHSQRQQVLSRFGKTKSAILLATDVAARGLNLKDVDWTVQYDPPCEIADYVHRSGRVARAGRAGHSLLFLLPSERGFLDALKQRGISTMTALSLTNLLNQAAKQCGDLAAIGNENSGWSSGEKHKDASAVASATSGSSIASKMSSSTASSSHDKKRSSGSRSGEAFCGELQRRLEDCVAQDDARVKAAYRETPKRKRTENMKREGLLVEMARDAYISHIRAYPTKEKAIRHIFSARALHLGHVARSFALKEPPKSLASRQKQRGGGGKDGDAHASSKLQFREDGDDDGDDDVPTKRRSSNKKQKKSASTKQQPKREGGSRNRDSSKLQSAKQLLLANAVKLQNSAMDML